MHSQEFGISSKFYWKKDVNFKDFNVTQSSIMQAFRKLWNSFLTIYFLFSAQNLQGYDSFRSYSSLVRICTFFPFVEENNSYKKTGMNYFLSAAVYIPCSIIFSGHITR